MSTRTFSINPLGNKYAVMRGNEIVKVFDTIKAACDFALFLTKGKPQNQSVARHDAYVAKIAKEAELAAKEAERAAKEAKHAELVAKRAEQANRDMSPIASTLVTQDAITWALSGCDDPWHNNAERVKFRKQLESIVGSELGGIKWRGNDTVVVYQPLNVSKNMWHSVTYSC